LKTCREAIEEVFKNVNAVLSTKDVISQIYRKYPNRPWKENTISAHLIGLSINHPSSIHYPSTNRHAFLLSLRNGYFRLWDQKADEVHDTAPIPADKDSACRKEKNHQPGSVPNKDVTADKDETILNRVFGIVSFLDAARWEERNNYNLINK